jgi:TadE-like protein
LEFPHASRFMKSQAGTALIEFALVFPILMAMLVGVHETTRVLRASHHMTNYVNAAAYDVAGTGTDLTQASLRELVDRVALMVPEIIRSGSSPWSSSASGYVDIGISMIRMTPRVATCQRNCSYKATVQWSFGNMRRPACAEMSEASADAEPSQNSLPSGVFQSGALAVVDLSTSYRYMLTSLAPPKNLRASGYFPVRNWRQLSSPTPRLTGSDETYSADVCMTSS